MHYVRTKIYLSGKRAIARELGYNPDNLTVKQLERVNEMYMLRRYGRGGIFMTEPQAYELHIPMEGHRSFR